jgi:nucleotidyltransferase/DNA polymerase involved in DNA repair
MARQQLAVLEAAGGGGGGVADALRDAAACSTVVGGAGLSADSALDRLLAVGARRASCLCGCCCCAARAASASAARPLALLPPSPSAPSLALRLACLRTLPKPGGLIAARLRAGVADRLEYTMSAGVAANKLVAKIGSAMHKPDAQTLVPQRAVPGLMAVRFAVAQGAPSHTHPCAALQPPSARLSPYTR